MAAPVLTKLKASPGQLVYQIAGDGEAGVVSITQALLAVDLANGPLKDLLLEDLPTANQANARAKLLGEGNSSNGVAGQWESCANAVIFTRDTEANCPGIDATTDAVTATRGRYLVDIPAVACVVLVFINYRHSILG